MKWERSSLTEAGLDLAEKLYKRIYDGAIFGRSPSSKKILRYLYEAWKEGRPSDLMLVAQNVFGITEHQFTDREQPEHNSKMRTAFMRFRDHLNRFNTQNPDDPIVFKCYPGIVEIAIEDRMADDQLSKDLHVLKTAQSATHSNYSGQVDRAMTEKQFEQFFGCPIERAHEGQIVVQADTIDDLLIKLAEETVVRRSSQHKSRRKPRPREIPATSRFFKARLLIDKGDTEGAFAVRDAILKDLLHGGPRVVLRSRHSVIDSQPTYEIAMGLGFTGLTDIVIQECREWLDNAKWPDCGDAVSLDHRLAPKTTSELKCEKEPRRKGNRRDGNVIFHRILPREWDSKARGREYMKRWKNRLHSDGKDVDDYAIILRYTEGEMGRRRVVLVLAGFSDRGTCAAGHFVAAHWKELWTSYVKDDFNGDGTPKRALGHIPPSGDFLAVISGYSCKPSEWKEVKSLAVTPKKLFDNRISCEWQERIGSLKAVKYNGRPKCEQRLSELFAMATSPQPLYVAVGTANSFGPWFQTEFEDSDSGFPGAVSEIQILSVSPQYARQKKIQLGSDFTAELIKNVERVRATGVPVSHRYWSGAPQCHGYLYGDIALGGQWKISTSGKTSVDFRLTEYRRGDNEFEDMVKAFKLGIEAPKISPRRPPRGRTR